MPIFNFTKFFESRGLPQPTLAYFDEIYNQIENDLMKYLKSKNKSTVVNHIINPQKVDPLFPISSIQLKVSFDPTSENYGWLFSSTGDCRPFTDNGSQILEDGTVLLIFGIGILLERKKLSKRELEDLKTDIRSSIHHELNHGYEHYNRKIKKYPHVQDALTFAVDINKKGVPSEVWECWESNISYNLYYTEKFEMNAISQESIPFVMNKNLGRLKREWRGWKIIKSLISFRSDIFKKKMIKIINQTLPDKDPIQVMSEIKDGLSESLRDLMNKYGESNPSLSPESIDKMGIDKFLKYCEGRFNKGGESLRRRVLRNYTHRAN